MLKRITSFLLAIVLFAGLVLTGAPVVSAASDMGVSDALVEVLKKEEGFSAKPYWDYSQYTIGYGTRCPSDMVDYYKENGITKEAAETLLRNYLSGTESAINKKLIDKYELELTQGQFDALVCFTYNLGTAWLSDSSLTIHKAIRSGATGSELINAFALWCNAGGSILPGLVRRRLCEANMYLNGKYSNTRPDDYCYVYYNANGGSVEYRIQGYDAGEGVAPKYTPTYEGHTFLGWYTAKTGGTQITKLTQSLNGDTLYARWDGVDQEEETVTTEGVAITVTGSGVNLRKGPGTNYTIVGTASKGDEFTVTETAKCDTYTWGKIGEDKWICLQYTNYEEASQEQQPEETQPEETTESVETTEPESGETTETTVSESTETTVTETTVPETTVPETTVPETTVPETTEPETTVPETTEETVDNTTVTGKVKASKLAVRKGPGSSYKVVKNIKKGTKVTINQRKTIDGIVWGKISSGWISVRHVTLDAPETETTVPETTVPETTVPETTVPETTAPETTEPETTAPEVDNTKVTGKVKASKLAVRKGPGSSYKVVKNIKKGTKVTITQRMTIDGTVWGKISSGWISVRHVTLDSTSEETTSATTEQTETVTLTGTVKASKLAVRKGAGSSYAVKKHLKKGTKVTITQLKTVKGTVWGKISSGWISMNHVVLDQQTQQEETTVKKTVTASCLNVRATASTSAKIVGYYYRDTEVTILETKEVGSTTWGKTSEGWISMEYVK